MRRHHGLLVITSLIFIANPGAVLAGCAESVGLLAKQIDLITQAGPLSTDPKAALGPGDTQFAAENPALKARTAMAFDVFKPAAAKSRTKADWEFPMNLARAAEELAKARTAQNEGNVAACDEAISVGLDAATRARGWLR